MNEDRKQNDAARERERYATDPAFADRKRSRSGEYYRANAERLKAAARARRAANPELFRERDRKKRQASPQKIKERSKRYWDKNREKLRAREPARRLRKYGLTRESYQALVEWQFGTCALCETDLQTLKPSLIHIDHCHTTGRVRGVLCVHCNTLLGLAKEKTSTLRRAITYLERNPS